MPSVQIGKMGMIDLLGGDFSLSDGQVFNIKNDSDDPVLLEVQLAGMKGVDFVETIFDVGWNPEIVRVVKQSSTYANLKYGY